MKVFNKQAQSTLEYAIVTTVVIGALVLMQHYMRRGVEGKLRANIDDIGEQYSAGNVTSKYTTEQKGTITTKETFGLSPTDGTYKPGETEGISYFTVKTLSKDYQVERSATGSDAEKVTKKLSEESLFKK